jgi:NAD(P)-dependent dehydrogenase (short-subunit alcohol dehydrogenase family)
VIEPLADRTAIVTGGSRGLGLEIAGALAAAGARVAIAGRDAAAVDAAVERLRAAGARAEGVAADVADPDGCAAVAALARDRLGPVDVLVNNAGVHGPMGPLDVVDWDEWEHAVRVNLFGTALMCRAVLPEMRGRGWGKIVNLSGGGATGPRPNISAYAASKAAIVRLTETLAEELRGTGIDVNAIAPGALNTRLLDEVLAAGPGRVGAEEHAQALRQRDEGGADPALAARLAVFLASPASDGISGRLLSAQWDDWAELPRLREALMASDVYTLRRIVPADRPQLGSSP